MRADRTLRMGMSRGALLGCGGAAIVCAVGMAVAAPAAPGGTGGAPVVSNAPVSVAAAGQGSGHGASADAPSADEVLSMLRGGNERFIDGILSGPRRDEQRRHETFGGQHPVAGVLSCADSRVPVEVIFDQGIGDLFVVRVAGNVAGGSEIASLQYGVEHLNLPLVVVMGHTRCGAVQAAVDGVKAEGPLGELIGEILPAVESIRSQNLPNNARLAATVRANVRHTLVQLQRDPVIGAAVTSGKTRLIGAVYDLNAGVVQWVDPAPLPVGQAGELVRPGGDTPNEPAAAEKPTAAAHAAEPPVAAPAAPPAPAHTPTAAEAPAGPAATPRRLSRPPLPGTTAEPKSPAQSSVAEPHSSAHESGGDGHASADVGHDETEPSTRPATAAKKRDNWLVLGSMLTAASGLSIGVIQWLSGRKG